MDHYQDEELAQAALSALEKTAGMKGQLVPLPMDAGRGDYHPDVAIKMQAGGVDHYFYGECKATVDRLIILAQVKAKLDGLNAPGLLIARHLSRKMVEAGRTIGLQLLDTAGNAYLNAPGLYILVKGQDASATQLVGSRARGGGSTSALRMIFALLVHPELTRAPYREIGRSAGIALGTVGGVFQDLAQRGLITGPDHAHGRRILEPVLLLDEWVATYPTRLRPKLRPRRFAAPNPNWWQDIDPIDLGAWWGGEVAADRLAGLLRSATQTLYVAPERRQGCLQTLIARYGLRPDPRGEFELLDTFWNLPRSSNHAQCVPPMLVYADLMASLDPRNLEVAKVIRDRVIADVQHST